MIARTMSSSRFPFSQVYGGVEVALWCANITNKRFSWSGDGENDYISQETELEPLSMVVKNLVVKS